MGLDLHTHSSESDGLLRPKDVVSMAKAAGLDGIALTDHDTVAGLSEAIATGAAINLPVVSGIELTTDFNEEEVHVLGYGIDPTYPPLLEKVKHIMESRIERAEGMLKRLERAGIHLTMEQVRMQAPGRFIGRPHIYRALKAYGWIDDDPEKKAFQYYLGNHGIAYLPHREIESFEAVEIIRDAGGIPALAHPGRMARVDFLKRLVDHGLGGIEVYYPMHRPYQVHQYEKLAEKFGLLKTGGSDFHGDPDGVKIGTAQAPVELLRKLLADTNRMNA